MPDDPVPLTPARATREARAALGAAGLAAVRRVTSRPAAAPGGRREHTIRTDVHLYLYPHSDRDAVAAALRALPGLVDEFLGTATISLYRGIDAPAPPGRRYVVRRQPGHRKGTRRWVVWDTHRHGWAGDARRTRRDAQDVCDELNAAPPPDQPTP